ncbi:MAG: NAD-dependent epimerase/dehydratase family protein [Elusimicrobiota bacterium]|jgi:nucleoside-diphosphate-sugar epimerase|nr:NAD-dependent epimerase/dehydratase family protein [Elusimicrobiota bacterium]
MKKAVITGGLGFVGRVLTQRLVQEGWSVKVLSRSLPRGEGGNPSVQVVKVDYNDIAALSAALDGADTVFHLAAAIFAFNREEFERANVALTANLAEAAVKAGVKAFIYLSSQAAAGPSQYKNNPRAEDDTPAPVSDYGATKLAAEEIVEKLPADMHKVILRAPVVYGRDDSGVSKIAAWVKRGFMINAGPADTFFNFIYVDDLAQALYTAAETPQAGGQIFFVCENAGYSWKYFIEAMAGAMSCPRPVMFSLPHFALEIAAFIYEFIARIFRFAPALNYDKVKEADIKGHWLCNPQKWINLTGQKFVPLKEGLEVSFK